MAPNDRNEARTGHDSVACGNGSLSPTIAKKSLSGLSLISDAVAPRNGMRLRTMPIVGGGSGPKAEGTLHHCHKIIGQDYESERRHRLLLHLNLEVG